MSTLGDVGFVEPHSGTRSEFDQRWRIRARRAPLPRGRGHRRGRHRGPGARRELAPNDVVDLENLGFTRIYPDLFENGHEALAESFELLARVPDLADSDAPVAVVEGHV